MQQALLVARPAPTLAGRILADIGDATTRQSSRSCAQQQFSRHCMLQSIAIVKRGRLSCGEHHSLLRVQAFDAYADGSCNPIDITQQSSAAGRLSSAQRSHAWCKASLTSKKHPQFLRGYAECRPGCYLSTQLTHIAVAAHLQLTLGLVHVWRCDADS